MSEDEQNKLGKPKKELIRWGDLVEWLGNWGFTEDEVRKYLRSGIIRAYYIEHTDSKSGRRVKGKAYYHVRQIEGKLLSQFING